MNKPKNPGFFALEHFVEAQAVRCIVSDPPWMERGGGKIKRGADRHYDLLRTEGVINIMRPFVHAAHPDTHLWLWVTNNHLQEGTNVLHNLGFRYIINLVWVKTKGFGLGQYPHLQEQGVSE